jgi:hypothetical protein
MSVIKQNIKQVATRFNLSQEKIKTICLELFEYIPESFTDEQINQIQISLAAVIGDIKALTSSVEQKVQQGEIVAQDGQKNPMLDIYKNCQNLATQPQKIAALRAILGTRTINKNIEYWEATLSIVLKKAYAQQEAMLVTFEAASSQKINETFDRLTDQVTDALRGSMARSRANAFSLVTGDIEKELEALATMEIDLSNSRSVYDPRINQILNELSQLH